MIASVYLYNMIKTLQVGVPGDDALKLHCNPPPQLPTSTLPRLQGETVDVGQKGLAHHHGDVLIWTRGGLTLAGRGGL